MKLLPSIDRMLRERGSGFRACGNGMLQERGSGYRPCGNGMLQERGSGFRACGNGMLQERGSGFRACGNGMLQGRGRKEEWKTTLFWGLGFGLRSSARGHAGEGSPYRAVGGRRA